MPVALVIYTCIVEVKVIAVSILYYVHEYAKKKQQQLNVYLVGLLRSSQMMVTVRLL
jgi:hypothetical protein